MNQNRHLEEVRWHGRGGQGAVLGASMLGSAAALYEGRHAVSFPSFGAERRGAPVQAFTRISDKAIRTRSQIYNPTVIIVLDDTLLDVVDITAGALNGTSILVNTRKSRGSLKKIPDSLDVTTVDVTAIAKEQIGVAIVNTAMLGVLAGVTGIVSLDSVKKAIADTLPERIIERNIAAAEAAYKEVGAK
jgi:pyruvate ferredoxin oxidoreductase gamma subunit